MRIYIKVLSLAIALFIFVGCSSQSQNQKQEQNSENSMNKLGMELNVSKAVDRSKAATNTTAKTSSTKKYTDKEKKPLEGLTICIDAGHGKTKVATNRKEPIAPDSKIMKAATASGTSGVFTKISEESLNLTVSMKLKKALLEKGAKIIMVRETSECDLTNVERTKLWNSSGADLTIRIHANGINDSKVSGVLMMIPGDKYIKDKGMLKKSAQVGQCILEEVLNYTKAKSRGTIKSEDLTGFNWSKIPVVLLEMGFMTNPQEDKLLNSDAYQNKIVAGIVEGVQKYQDSLIEDKTK
jgi:N-acetylmuramoyl-L-alanine amidase